MKRVLLVAVGIAVVCAVAYLSVLNDTRVEFHLSSSYATRPLPVAALLVGAFVSGVVVVLFVVLLQAGRRAIVAWRQERAQRRTERIDRWEQQGAEMVWQGNPQQGRSLLQRAARRRPGSAYPVLALAASYRDTGETRRARQVLSDAATKQHTNPDVLFALAEAQRAAGDAAASIEVLERLRALHPRAPRVLRALRDAYVAAGRWQDAVTLQDALLTELRDAESTVRERELMLALQYQAALPLAEPGARREALEGLVENAPSAVPVLVSLGDTLEKDGQEGEASVLWERALRSTPRTVFVERLARLASEGRHRDRIRTVLRKLKAERVNTDSVHLLNAQLHLDDGNLDEAAGELDAVQNPATAPPLLHRLWGDVHRRRGELEQAVSAFGQATDTPWAYQCNTCQRGALEWAGYCPACGSWDTYRAKAEIALS
jgi:uncharacterized protein HemY